jgi:hypothetical protein
MLELNLVTPEYEYAVLLLRVAGWSFDEVEELLGDDARYSDAWFYAQDHSTLELNRVLHQWHSEHPELRGEALELVASANNTSAELWSDHLVPWDYSSHPSFELMKATIERAVARWSDDLSLRVYVSWVHDHLERENGWDMENVVVEVNALDNDVLERAVEALNQVMEFRQYV